MHERMNGNAAALHRVALVRVPARRQRVLRRLRLTVQRDLAVAEDIGGGLAIAGDDKVGAVFAARQRVQVTAQMRLEDFGR